MNKDNSQYNIPSLSVDAPIISPKTKSLTEMGVNESKLLEDSGHNVFKRGKKRVNLYQICTTILERNNELLGIKKFLSDMLSKINNKYIHYVKIQQTKIVLISDGTLVSYSIGIAANYKLQLNYVKVKTLKRAMVITSCEDAYKQLIDGHNIKIYRHLFIGFIHIINTT